MPTLLVNKTNKWRILIMRMSNKKRGALTSVLCVIMVLCTLLSLGTVSVFAASATDEGLSFIDTEKYIAKNALAATPYTYEATIRFPAGFTGRGGLILGNYAEYPNPCFNFEIAEGGHPRFYVIDTRSGTPEILDITFDEVNVYTGEWIHLAIVRDNEDDALICYVNGVQAQSKALPSRATPHNLEKLVLGGDNRTNPKSNDQYFKGKMKDLSLYMDVRTAQEIKSDYKNSEVDFTELIGHWELPDDSVATGLIEDTGAFGNDFVLKNDSPYFSKKAPVEDYAFSMAVIGDTQCLNIHNPQNMHKIYDWIAENAEEKNTKFVIQLGDITDKDNPWEYALAKSCMQTLDGIVPYSIVRGNHDKVTNYDKYITQEEYGHMIAGSYDNTMRNIYYTLQVGNIKYLIFSLDIGTEKKMLTDWAGPVIEAHPDYNVIITTHIYLTVSGTHFSNAENAKPKKYNTSADAINSDVFWDTFVSKYENIKLVLCGHDPYDNILVTKHTGKNGNVVREVLIDPQGTDLNNQSSGGVGMVAMLYFSNDGKTVQVEYYSTVRERYFKEENQLTFTLEVVQSGDEAPDAGGHPKDNQQNTPGDDQNDNQGGNQAGADQNAGNNQAGGNQNTPGPQTSVTKTGLVVTTPMIIGVAAGGVGAFAVGGATGAVIGRKRKKKAS